MRSSNKKGTVAYYIGDTLLVKGSVNQVLKADVDNIATGQHTITAKIYNGENQQVATKNYLLWKDQSCMLLLAPQCQYILEQFSSLSDFSAALEGQSDCVEADRAEKFFCQRRQPPFIITAEKRDYTSAVMFCCRPLQPTARAMYIHLCTIPCWRLGCSSTQMNNTTKAMEIKYKNKTSQAGITDVTKSYPNCSCIKNKGAIIPQQSHGQRPVVSRTNRSSVCSAGWISDFTAGRHFCYRNTSPRLC